MGKYKELALRAIDNDAGEEAWVLADEFICEVAQREPRMYEEFICRLEKLAYRISKEKAEMIVKSMQPKGQYWNFQQVKEFAKEHGVTGDWIDWYLVMNMVYNDYCDTAKLYNLQNDPEFFFSLARDFIEDPDARPLKVEKYFLD